MPTWISVYCSKALGDMPPADTLAAEIRKNDFFTLAEDYEIDEDLVDPALANFRIEPDDSGFNLHYRSTGERPIAVHYWTKPERVKEEIQEVHELLGGDSAAVGKVKQHLQTIQAVVGIEMGFSQLEDMGIVFAYEIARWFGRNRRGMIKDDNDNWLFTSSDGGFIHL